MAELLIVTCLAMLLDVATGVAGAVKTNELASGRMREGLWHKAGFCGLIAAAYLFEFAAGHADLGISIPATGAVCVWIVVTEAVSILENLCVINPQIAASPLGKVFADTTGKDAK